ncbi:MAG TPA: DegT/DnrJ/EryC1/StrS family aminotransferase [Candidatus Dormibacteraeota bacterium]|nr:DegT/DnrJ/EryC1/StrS family aminotransferase [Candidatus Dormibacteraeota bacterium]
MTLPLVDLQAQYRTIDNEVMAAVDRVLKSGQFVLGPETDAFEHELASHSQAAHAVGTSSGTSALHLALLAAGVGPGDEVITVPFTFVATVAAIEYAGARPVLVDIAADSFTMNPALVEAAITPRTRAIVPVHLYGQPADMSPLLEIASRHGLKLIEDACQAHGAEHEGRRVGALGDAGCFSFYPGKNLGAYGEGGAVVTNDAELARTVRTLRHWGQVSRYVHELKGFNYRLHELQAAILRVKLRHLDDWTEGRRAHARRYDQLLAGVVRTPVELPYARHVYHVYVIRSDERESLARALEAEGIHTGVHYPVPVHLQPAWADLGYAPGSFPVSEQAAREVLSLPMYPELPAHELERVAELVATHSSHREPAWRST